MSKNHNTKSMPNYVPPKYNKWAKTNIGMSYKTKYDMLKGGKHGKKA